MRFARAENAADLVLGEVEPEHLATLEIRGVRVDHLQFDRGDLVGGIAGDEQVEVGDGFRDDRRRGTGGNGGRGPASAGAGGGDGNRARVMVPARIG